MPTPAQWLATVHSQCSLNEVLSFYWGTTYFFPLLSFLKTCAYHKSWEYFLKCFLLRSFFLLIWFCYLQFYALKWMVFLPYAYQTDPIIYGKYPLSSLNHSGTSWIHTGLFMCPSPCPTGHSKAVPTSPFLITALSQWVLVSGSTSIPTLFFYRISLAFQTFAFPCKFQNQPVTAEITLNLYMNLGNHTIQKYYVGLF